MSQQFKNQSCRGMDVEAHGLVSDPGDPSFFLRLGGHAPAIKEK